MESVGLGEEQVGCQSCYWICLSWEIEFYQILSALWGNLATFSGYFDSVRDRDSAPHRQMRLYRYFWPLLEATHQELLSKVADVSLHSSSNPSTEVLRSLPGFFFNFHPTSRQKYSSWGVLRWHPLAHHEFWWLFSWLEVLYFISVISTKSGLISIAIKSIFTI